MRLQLQDKQLHLLRPWYVDRLFRRRKQARKQSAAESYAFVSYGLLRTVESSQRPKSKTRPVLEAPT